MSNIWSAIGEHHRSIVAAQQQRVLGDAPDPCPGCRPGIVCRTPKCGRLKLRPPGPKIAPVESVSGDTQAPRPLNDHEVAEFVNTLTRIATTYRDSAQLRCRLSHVVLDTLTSHHLKAKA